MIKEENEIIQTLKDIRLSIESSISGQEIIVKELKDVTDTIVFVKGMIVLMVIFIAVVILQSIIWEVICEGWRNVV